jgi:hypothetical protein
MVVFVIRDYFNLIVLICYIVLVSYVMCIQLRNVFHVINLPDHRVDFRELEPDMNHFVNII